MQTQTTLHDALANTSRIIAAIDAAFDNDDMDALVEILADNDAETIKYQNAREFFALMEDLR